MKSKDQEEQIRSYLLRTLSEGERSLIEERLFTEETFCDPLEAAEDELIEDFLRGELSREEARQFETAFVDTPRRRQQVEIARAIRDHVLRKETAAHPTLLAKLSSVFRPGEYRRLAYVAAGSIAIAGVLTWTAVTARNAVSLARNAQQQANTAYTLLDTLRQELARASARQNAQSDSPVLSFVLISGAMRGQGETKTVFIPAGVQSVRFELQSAEAREAGRYVVAISGENGPELWSSNVQRPAATPGMAITVPAAVFRRNGFYVVTSEPATKAGQVSDAEDFSFNVARQ